MAGIGFELKKIFREKDSVFTSMRGYAVTGMVTEGPMLLTLLLLFTVRYIMQQHDALQTDLDTYLFLITYVMIFSLIITNAVLLFMNRFISDCIYQKKDSDILPSFFGIIFQVLGISDVLMVFYLLTLPISASLRICTLILFSCMLVVWIQNSYISAIKQYTLVLIAFIVSAIVGIGLSLLFMSLGFPPLDSALWGTTIGFVVMMFFLMTQLIAYYPNSRLKLFVFLPQFDTNPILILTGLFMGLSLFGHNFVSWTTPFRNQIFPTGVFCSRYDVPTFYAALTIIPMQVQFVVALEVNFSRKYREYFDTILYGGNLQQIRSAKESMQTVLFRELSHMMEVQMIFTVLAVTWFGNVLGTLGLDEQMVGIYRILCFGYCLYGFAKSVIIVLMYFDDRRGACQAAGILAIGSIALSALMLPLGTNYWGLGFTTGSILAGGYALIRLKNYITRLEYHVFCQQPLFIDKHPGLFTRLERWLDKDVRHKHRKGN